jgi:GNAT superfamily N-acetyltransferase
MMQGDPGDELIIRLASPADIGHIVSIDDDACALFERAGVRLAFGPDHPYARAEYARWLQSAKDGTAFLAGRADTGAVPVGVLVMGHADGAPYLDQLSVRVAAMRQGLGRRLLDHAIAWAGDQPLWLTTYAHLPWNRPFYERHGFAVVEESACGPDIRADLAEQRRWLPHPRERVAMRRLPTG